VTDRPWVTRVRAVIADRRTRLLLVEDGNRHRLPFVEVEGTDDELPTIARLGTFSSSVDVCHSVSVPGAAAAVVTDRMVK